jgi:hypothetical protein
VRHHKLAWHITFKKCKSLECRDHMVGLHVAASAPCDNGCLSHKGYPCIAF